MVRSQTADLIYFVPQLNECVLAPKALLSVGRPVDVDLFIISADMDELHPFKSIGQSITSDDVDAMKVMGGVEIYIRRSDQLKASAAAIRATLGDEPMNPVEVKSSSVQMMKLVADDRIVPPKEMIEQVPTLVVGIVDKFRKTSSAEAYQQIMNSTQGEEAITAHNKQVSGLAVLMMLSLGNSSLEELSDLATAGLVHDLGLRRMPREMVELYLSNEISRSSARESIFAHIDHSLAMIREQNLHITKGVVKMVELHHENYDGSGPKKQAGVNIPRPARVLRIADEIVVTVAAANNKINIRDALNVMAGRKGIKDQPIFDPDLVAVLSKTMVPETPKGEKMRFSR